MNGAVYKHTMLNWHIDNKMLLHIESMTIKCYCKFNQRNLFRKLKGTLEGKKTEVDSQQISIAVKGAIDRPHMKVIPPIITLSFPRGW